MTQRSHITCFHLYEIARIGKSIETEQRLVVAKGLGTEETGSNRLINKGFSFGVMQMFWNKIEARVAPTQ